MLSNHAAGDRAARMAIATGTAVNLHIIQATQQVEGFDACFGRAITPCDQTDCSYYEPCMALLAFDAAETAATPKDAPPKPSRAPSETIVHRELERLPRQIPAASYGLEPTHETT